MSDPNDPNPDNGGSTSSEEEDISDEEDMNPDAGLGTNPIPHDLEMEIDGDEDGDEIGPVLLRPVPMEEEDEEVVVNGPNIWERCEEFIKEEVGDSPVMMQEKRTVARNKRLTQLYRTMSLFLPAADAKNLRLLSRKVNELLINDASFMKRFKTQFRTNWYRTYPEIERMELCPLWNEVKLQSFLFHRNNQIFKDFWQTTAQKLETLKIDGGSLECEGLKFLVDFAPNLANLKLKNCKLRDVDNYHKNPRRTQVTAVPVPQRNVRGITNLHFEHMNMIETCFMEYLCKTIENLEELNMSYCFTGQPDIGAPPTELYFQFFSPLLLKLINKNSETLKKITFRGNYGQLGLFQNMINYKSLKPTQLTLGLFSPSEKNGKWDPLNTFIRNQCNELRKLDLQIMEDSSAEEFSKLIEAFRLCACPLQTLKMDVIGNSENRKIELNEFVRNLPNLTRLVISDSKKLDSRIQYLVGGQRYHQYRLHNFFGCTPLQIDQICKASITNIETNFMSELPPNLKEFCLRSFIPSPNFLLESLNNNLQVYKKLNKLEIHGPWIHAMNEIVPKLLTLKQLETLALSNCSIQDTFITGLGTQAVMDLRRAVAYIFGLPNVGEDITRKKLEDAILKAPNYRGLKTILRRPRSKLSDLSNLKYLDLSSNLQVSDLGIYDSMKLPHVETLVLNSCSRVTDVGLQLIGVNCPSLRTLSIKHCRKVSQFGLNEMVKNFPHIQTIYTTRIVRNRGFEGFLYDLCDRFESVIQTSIETTTEGFIEDEEED